MWSLYQNEKFLAPLRFSNGKTQEGVVKEVLDSINEGSNIIFIRGICGTGKSAIALNIAKELGKTSIVVPGKSLQRQYKEDYEENKYILGKEGKKLKISVITGRNNHECKFATESKLNIPKIKREVDSTLDIFDKPIEEPENKEDDSAERWDLPCKIEIKERNWNKLKEYIRQNKNVDPSNFNEIRDVKRASVAPACPYWSPVLPEEYSIKNFPDSRKKSYMGLQDTRFIIHQGKPGCGFYSQFNSYLDSDIIVFNSMKYVLETALNRKPATEVEIIDECDEFLDQFSNQRNINLERMQNALIYVMGMSEGVEEAVRRISNLIKIIKMDERIQDAIQTGEIIHIKETPIHDLLKVFLEYDELLNEIDDESYLFDVEETARIFRDFLDESYCTFSKNENSISINIVTTNLAKKFKGMVDKNKIFVLMSGTLHEESVLRTIFGLDNFKIIEAEVESQGRIETVRTGKEMDCKYSNFSSGKHSRKDYLLALSKVIETAKKPTLVHVNAFSDLPSEQELNEYDIDNLISREKLKEIQGNDKEGKIIERFKDGQMNVLFSTRASRGIDFPGEQCNSIIFTKYPNPNVQDPFWKILNKTRPNDYWSFYRDKAKRELWQKVYRGLRFKEDHVYVLSPDTRVLDAFEK